MIAVKIALHSYLAAPCSRGPNRQRLKLCQDLSGKTPRLASTDHSYPNFCCQKRVIARRISCHISIEAPPILETCVEMESTSSISAGLRKSIIMARTTK